MALAELVRALRSAPAARAAERHFEGGTDGRSGGAPVQEDR
jgi:hypothetical protein